MVNEEHLAILRQGVEAWNAWRDNNPRVRPDLSGARLPRLDLSEADLVRADLSGSDLSRTDLDDADLRGANLNQADLRWADLGGADLSGAELTDADLREASLDGAKLRGAKLVGARLRGADLSGADLEKADLRNADLTAADLRFALLVETRFAGARLNGCLVYGTSVWNVTTTAETDEADLVITNRSEPTVTVDNLEVAQFVYLLLNNQRIRQVIDTITSKVVLILGRFTPDRKAVLDALRDELRKRDYLPIVFDFDQPTHRSVQETVSTLAHMARFVIADITDPKSIPQELAAIVPFLPSVPVQPLLHVSGSPWGMWEHFPRYPWVLPIHRYDATDELLSSLGDAVISPAEVKAAQLQGRKPA